MRGYEISIFDKGGGLWTPPNLASINTGASFSSLINGDNNPGALNVEFDIWTAPYHQTGGASWVRVTGIGLKEIGDASNLNGFSITVKAGMRKGLPLATAAFNAGQYGTLVNAQIYQAFGNWVGVEQSLELILQPPTGTNDAPANLVFNWKANTSLETGIRQTLSTAYPGYSITINIAKTLKLPQDQQGYHYTLEQFSNYVQKLSQNLLQQENYTGVIISVLDKEIYVDDGTVPGDTKTVLAQDLMGQPTWLEDGLIQVKTVLRADIKPFDLMKLPQTQVTTGPNAPSPFTNAKLTFQGGFQVQTIRNVANFRMATGDAWVTIYDCAATGLVSAT